MTRWWDRYGLHSIFILIALLAALWIKKTQGSLINEIFYYVTYPFQSEEQLVLEERLTSARILELEQNISHLEQQNRQLKELLDYTATQNVSSIPAPIIGRNRDHWWKLITIGKGASDGIQKDYVVMGIGGLVGRVVHVTPHTSKVQLITDQNSRVGATLGTSRQVGYIQGDGSTSIFMNFFDEVTNIKAGDRIFTSHLSKLYPPGLPIGQVDDTVTEQTVRVPINLSAPIDVLEWVVVRSFEPRIK